MSSFLVGEHNSSPQDDTVTVNTIIPQSLFAQFLWLSLCAIYKYLALPLIYTTTALGLAGSLV